MSRRFRRRPSRSMVVAVILSIVFAARFGCDRAGQDSLSGSIQEGDCEVVRVVDGDTIIVRQAVDPSSDSGEKEFREARVRLLGVDTPETVKPNHPVEPWGPEASAFTKAFLKEGQVSLRLDRRRVDRYGRLLAYVFVDEKMLNEELVRAGLARVLVFPGDSATMSRLLRNAEKEAKSAKRGIWASSP